jgi:hypothetical protein
MEKIALDFCEVIESIIGIYLEPFSKLNHLHVRLTISGKLSSIKCHALMTEETYNNVISRRKIYNEIQLKYRLSMEGRAGYLNKQIIIEVSRDLIGLTLLNREIMAHVDVQFLMNAL